MANPNKKLGVPQGIRERVELLEKKMQSVFQTLETLVESNAALITYIGQDAIAAEVTKNQIAAIEAPMERSRQVFETGLRTGALVELPEVPMLLEDGSAPQVFVVTTSRTESGNQIYPSRNYLQFQEYAPPIRTVLAGMKVGDQVVNPMPMPTQEGAPPPEKTLIEVLAVYKVVQTVVDVPTPMPTPDPVDPS